MSQANSSEQVVSTVKLWQLHLDTTYLWVLTSVDKLNVDMGQSGWICPVVLDHDSQDLRKSVCAAVVVEQLHYRCSHSSVEVQPRHSENQMYTSTRLENLCARTDQVMNYSKLTSARPSVIIDETESQDQS